MTKQPGVALVTGGSTGTGRAWRWAWGPLGSLSPSSVVPPGTLAETRAALETEGVPAVVCEADVRDAEAVADAVASVERQLGPISTVVNGAGTALAIGPLWEVDPRDWWTDVETSLLGAFNVCRSVIPGMIARRSGRILNVSSYAGVRRRLDPDGYGLAKAGLANLTESLAASLEVSRCPRVHRDAGTGAHRHHEAAHGVAGGPTMAARSSRDRQDLDPGLFVRLVVTIAQGGADELNGRFVHALDDLGELVHKLDEVESEELYVLRLRRLARG